MRALKLVDFLNKLPKGLPFRLEEHAHPSVFLPQLDSSFLPPRLKEIEGNFINPEYPIIIISAPGAVGKSALARYIAAYNSLFLWDLSKIKLGDNSFIGTIANCFGSSNLVKILKDLEKANTGFIFDALDEAEILSGWQRVENFITELHSYTRSSNSPCLVLLARSETASLISIHLQLMNASYLLLEIDYFSEEQAKEFISLQIKKIANERQQPELLSRSMQHPIPFQEAISAIFRAIYNAFSYKEEDAWKNTSIQSFLGYAPVLQAIAVFISNFKNIQEVPKAVEEGLFDARGVSIASKIMENLLNREQQKVIGTLKEKEISGSNNWKRWESLYSASEQLERVLYLVQGNLDISILESDSAIPGWLIEPYYNAVKALLPQHPFVRNSEFSGLSTIAVFDGRPITFGEGRNDFFAGESPKRTCLIPCSFLRQRSSRTLLGSFPVSVFPRLFREGVGGKQLLGWG